MTVKFVEHTIKSLNNLLNDQMSNELLTGEISSVNLLIITNTHKCFLINSNLCHIKHNSELEFTTEDDCVLNFTFDEISEIYELQH